MSPQTFRIGKASALTDIQTHLALWRRGLYSRPELKRRLVALANAYRLANTFIKAMNVSTGGGQ